MVRPLSRNKLTTVSGDSAPLMKSGGAPNPRDQRTFTSRRRKPLKFNNSQVNQGGITQENEIPHTYIFNGHVVPSILIPIRADACILISRLPCRKPCN